MNERSVYIYKDPSSDQRVVVPEELTAEADIMGLCVTAIIIDPSAAEERGPQLIPCIDCETPFVSPDGGLSLLRCPSCNADQEERSRKLAQEYPGTQGDGFFCG